MYGAVVRGDKSKVKIGTLSSVQDRAVIKTVASLESGFPSDVVMIFLSSNVIKVPWELRLQFYCVTVLPRCLYYPILTILYFEWIIQVIGDQVTIGQGAILTSCTVGNRTVIGAGAIIQEGCEIAHEVEKQ